MPGSSHSGWTGGDTGRQIRASRVLERRQEAGDAPERGQASWEVAPGKLWLLRPPLTPSHVKNPFWLN